MPEIGEIKQGQAIGKAIWHAHIWRSCLDCGEEQWVLLAKGKPANLRCRTCARQRQVGVNHPKWKGGRVKEHYGYVYIKLQPDNFFYSMAIKNGYVLEHRLVVAKALGRCLLPWEIVHHKHDRYPAGSIEDKQDNRYPENLQLVQEMQHKQITILETHINKQAKLVKELQDRVTLLEAELELVKYNEPHIATRVR